MKKSVLMILVILLIIICNLNKKDLPLFLEENTPELAIYLENEKVQSIPQQKDEYYFDEEKSNCTNGSNVKWDYEKWGPVITNLTVMRTKCDFYFKKSMIEKGKTYKFNYTGSSQEFIIPTTGYYKFEIWGASGGNINAKVEYPFGGKGGYAAGTIFIKKGNVFYIYVGEEGKINGNTTFNGGGASAAQDDNCASGGGATDIRIKNGNWNDFESLKSRIMVAGAGAGPERIYAAGVGGGLESTSSFDINDVATQVKGYKFGIGQNAKTGVVASGAGGGYYGGGTASLGTSSTPFFLSSAGGSGFISGHQGCNAISIDSTENNIIHTNQPNHYSNLVFKNTNLRNGKENMPNFNDDAMMLGNTGNGYVKITYLGISY